MRNLTIKRSKSFIACLATMKIFIEDPMQCDLMINNVPCRKLGYLKNGEEKTFAIDNREARVYVIADKMSRKFCNEYVTIPEGEEDVFLSGKNKYNPASGNAFRFDGVTDEDVLKNRKKSTRVGIIVLVVAFIIGLGIGLLKNIDAFFPEEVKAETFSDSGMTITLTSQFIDGEDIDGYDAFFESEKIAVLALKEPFSIEEGFEDYTLEEYGQMVIDANEFDSSVVLKEKDGLTYFEFEYENTQYNEIYRYFSVVFKTDDAFWMVQFMTFKDDYEALMPDILSYAKSIKFD